MLDRKRHRRGAQLGEHGAVGEFDEGVNDALGVEYRGALLGAQPEEALGFDELEAFVGERGGVDRDFRAHRPVGVVEGVGGSNVGEACGGPVAECAAAGGEDDATHAGVRVALEALEDGVVFAVDGENFCAGFFGGGHDEFTGENEDLFGGEGEVFAGGEGGEGGCEAGGADDGDEDGVGGGELGEFNEAGEPADEVGAGGECAEIGAGGGVGGLVEEAHVANVEFARDGGEFFPPRVGRDADEFEFVRVSAEDAKGVFTDGAGRAEEDYAFAGGGRGGSDHGSGREGRAINGLHKFQPRMDTDGHGYRTGR